jgi:hypothetical protein
MGMKVNGTSGLTFPDTTTLASAGQASVRAWVNFNGTGTVAIRAAYNVTSITDNGTGTYTLNFTTTLPDANYAANLTAGTGVGSGDYQIGTLIFAPAAGSLQIRTVNLSGTLADPGQVSVSIFR